jgi:hypothetical protein
MVILLSPVISSNMRLGDLLMNPVIFAYVYPWISLGIFTGYIFRVKTRGELKIDWSGSFHRS